MLENILYILSECSLIAGALLLPVRALFGGLTQRFCFSVSKTAIVLSALFAVLFYNKSFLDTYFSVSAGTTIVFVLTAVSAFIWLIWASKWFGTHKDHHALWFCVSALMLLLCLKLISQTTHLGVLFVLAALLFFFQYVLFSISRQSEELYHTGRKYLLISALMMGLFAAVLFVLKDQNWQYEALGDYLVQAPQNVRVFALAGIFCILFFMLGAAPFNFWLADRIAPLVMPVAMYFVLIPVLMLWVLFFRLNNTLLIGFAEHISGIYLVFGFISVLFGVVGANASRFVKKIFASVGLYQTGVLLLVASTMKPNVFPASMIYMELYLYVLLGIYICLYAIKTSGEYANNLSAFKGLASVRPYIGGAFVFLVLMLIGLPPFVLFLTQFTMLMTVAKYPLIVYTVLLGCVMMAPVYLKIVQTVCFLPREKNFDRADFITYVGLIVYFVLLVFISVKPQYILFQETILSAGM